MQDIILDTNAIIGAVINKIDIQRELNRICYFRFRICVLDKTIRELEKLINEGDFKQKKCASLALKFIKAAGISILKTEGTGSADNEIARLGAKAIIVTQDKELKKKLKGRKIIIRQKGYLAWS
ncbi:hypothetical protein HZB88_01500 [archaeon]|nr:hypothetical protein [archaeon]